MEIVKEFLSPSKRFKSVIFKRDDEFFHIDVFIWDEEWETWIFHSHGLSLTDTAANAEKIALENLRNYSGELF